MQTPENILFLYMADPSKKQILDKRYAEEAAHMRQKGILTSTISLDNMTVDMNNITPAILASHKIIYRGRPLSLREYKIFLNILEKNDFTPFISLDDYLAAYSLYQWYPQISRFTPETCFFDLHEINENFANYLSQLNWKKYFVTSYNKSLDFTVSSPYDILKNVDKMKKIIDIHEGILIRRVEDYKLNSKQKYFIINDHIFSNETSNPPPLVVTFCASQIKSPFFSITAAERNDEEMRIVSIEDGQVSNLAGWDAERFAEIWIESLQSMQNIGDKNKILKKPIV